LRAIDHKAFEIPQAFIVIKNVNALSTDGTTMLAKQTMIIDQGEIQAIGTDYRLSEKCFSC
jgi:hypothetical protein